MKNYKTQNTELLRGAYQNYNRFGVSSLYGLYNSFSYAKARAWAYCEQLCKDYNGEDLRAISGNTFTFSAGFTFDDNGQKIFCYITPNHNRFYKVEG